MKFVLALLLLLLIPSVCSAFGSISMENIDRSTASPDSFVNVGADSGVQHWNHVVGHYRLLRR